MTTRAFKFAPGEFYHIYNRGVEKRVIFKDHFDHQRFIELLYLSNTTKPTDIRNISRLHISVYDWERESELVSIGAYCLMPNHFHLLVTPKTDDGVSLFMNKLGTSYSMYFNRKYKRSGTLFEGKFKAQHADRDEYLKYLFAYIHLNPIKLIQPDWKEKGIGNAHQAFSYLKTYSYSSFQDLLGLGRPENKIIDRLPFPNYFETVLKEQKELIEWLSFKEFLNT